MKRLFINIGEIKKYAITEIKYVNEDGSYVRELQVYKYYESAKRHFDDGIVSDN